MKEIWIESFSDYLCAWLSARNINRIDLRDCREITQFNITYFHNDIYLQANDNILVITTIDNKNSIEYELPIKSGDLKKIMDTLNVPVKQSEPSVKQSEPSVKQSEPLVKRSEPLVKQSEPLVKQSEPSVKQSEPSVKRSEPLLNVNHINFLNFDNQDTSLQYKNFWYELKSGLDFTFGYLDSLNLDYDMQIRDNSYYSIKLTKKHPITNNNQIIEFSIGYDKKCNYMVITHPDYSHSFYMYTFTSVGNKDIKMTDIYELNNCLSKYILNHPFQ